MMKTTIKTIGPQNPKARNILNYADYYAVELYSNAQLVDSWTVAKNKNYAFPEGVSFANGLLTIDNPEGALSEKEYYQRGNMKITAISAKSLASAKEKTKEIVASRFTKPSLK